MNDLYLQPETIFEKVAAETPLPEDPNAWPDEILQELFKQVPYIAAFTPNVQMMKVDAERGYAMGFVDVMNKTELQPNASHETMQAAGVQRVRIPIIVRDRKLQPFDMVLTEKNKMLPLTEERLSQAIFRPQTFDITSKSPGDTSIVGDIYPPSRQGSGMAGGAAMGKMASKQKTALGKMLGDLVKGTTDPARMANISRLATSRGAQLAAQGGDAAKKGLKYTTIGNVAAQRMAKMGGSILKTILPTINDSDFAKFASVLERPEIQAMMSANSVGCRAALDTLGNFEGGAMQKRAAALPHAIKPTVLQLTATRDEGYVVKVASHNLWDPHSYRVDRGRAFRDFGSKVVLAADQTGGVTVVEGGEAPAEESGPEAFLITHSGVYTVATVEGEALTGWVFSNLLDLDGTPLPMSLFTNGSQMAVQGEIAGSPSQEQPPLSEGQPQGHGCFLRQDEKGEFQATIPMEIRATMSNGGEVLFSTQTYDGREVDVAVQPNIQELTMTPEGHVLVPESFQWMPLEGDAVALVGSPEDVGKTAAALRSIAGSVMLRAGDANNISISGPLVEKIAYDQREFIDVDQALFLLGGLGVDPYYATMKIADAVTYHRPVEVRCSRVIKTAGELREEAKTAAIATLGKLPVLRRELFKEAASIPDPVAVDTVLSLGFINPENMAHFITFLPVLDDAQSKMCELLLGARLGARDLPIGPLEKSIRALEEVIKGLKILAFAQN